MEESYLLQQSPTTGAYNRIRKLGDYYIPLEEFILAENSVGTIQIQNDAVTLAKLLPTTKARSVIGNSSGTIGVDFQELTATEQGLTILAGASYTYIRLLLGLDTGDSPTFVGLTLGGDLSVQGGTTLGNAATDSITFYGRMTGNIEFAVDGTGSIGASSTTFRPANVFVKNQVGIVSATGNQLLNGHMETISFSRSGSSGGVFILNSSDTASSNAEINIEVGGDSAGDPLILLGLTGTSKDWTLLLDNSDSDKLKFLWEGATEAFVLSSTGNLTLLAGTNTNAPLTLPHGSAPTSPVDGDIWTTTAGLYVRINGATVGPLS